MPTLAKVYPIYKDIFATPIIRVFRDLKKKSRKIKWLGLDKFSKIAKLSCRENVLQ